MILHKVEGGIRSQQIPPNKSVNNPCEDCSIIIPNPHEKVNSNIRRICMKNEILAKINENPHEINGKRIILFSEIANILGRKRNSTLGNFKRNLDKYAKNADYFYFSPLQSRRMYGLRAPNGCYALSESGFMILANNMTALDEEGEKAIMQYLRADEAKEVNSIATAPDAEEKEKQLHVPVCIQAIFSRFAELGSLVSMFCDNAMTPEEKTMALHTIEDVLELRVREFESLLYSEK